MEVSNAEGLLKGVNYLRLEEAANRLSVSAYELLSLGVQGRISIWTPVLNPGMYEWLPSGTENILDFPHDAEFFREFDIEDYVIVLRKNLAEISAKGKTNIKSFVAPAQASATFHLKWGELHVSGRLPVDLGQFDIDYTGDPEKPYNHDEVMALSAALQDHRSSIEHDREMLQVTFQDPWEFVRSIDISLEAQSTTINHLFMSVNEVDRIVSQSPGNEKKDQISKPNGLQIKWTDDVVEEMISFRREKGNAATVAKYGTSRQRLDAVKKGYHERKKKEEASLVEDKQKKVAEN